MYRPDTFWKRASRNLNKEHAYRDSEEAPMAYSFLSPSGFCKVYCLNDKNVTY